MFMARPLAGAGPVAVVSRFLAPIRWLATFVAEDGVSSHHPPPLFTQVMSGRHPPVG